MKTWKIRRLAREIEEFAEMIGTLKTLKEHGIDKDIFYEDGPIYEDDDNSIDGHISFYKSIIKEKLRAIAEELDENKEEENE